MYMQVSQVTFSIASTMPLSQQYANVKPFASATVTFDADEPCDPETPAGQALIKQAYATAQDAVLSQIAQFRQDFRALYGEDSLA
jgi:hypothetical protein